MRYLCESFGEDDDIDYDDAGKGFLQSEKSFIWLRKQKKNVACE